MSPASSADVKAPGDGAAMNKLYERAALTYFVIATVALLVCAFGLLGLAVWEVLGSAFAPNSNLVLRVRGMLDGIGLMIIGFAVVEASTFIAEEELLRKRELRSTRESRRSITKFITIIVIAASLEALVMVFKASREAIPMVLYPSILFLCAMFALVALGTYQWLSRRVEGKSGHERKRAGTVIRRRTARSSGNL